MWHPKHMFDSFRGNNTFDNGGSQRTSTQTILQRASDLEYQLPRLEFEEFTGSPDHHFLELPRSSSESSNSRQADRGDLQSIDLCRADGNDPVPGSEGRNLLACLSSKEEEDPNLVTWDSPNDPTNPLNWTRSRKWIATLIVSSFTFISPVSSTMVAPSLDAIAEEFHITSSIEKVLVMSIFLLAYAVGPFLLGPLSEMYGRTVVLQSANMVYLIFNTACGFAGSKEQILAFRFLSGLGGSAPQAIGGGVLSDCWRAEERGKSIAIYSVAPFIGPAVGPIAGGFITQHTTWRWVFWATSIADAAVQVISFLFLDETYAPRILAVKAKKLRRETGNKDLHTKWEEPDRTFFTILRKNLVRPFIMLFTQPAIQALALYRAYLYGLMYLVLSTFPLVWEKEYNQPTGIASLNYLSLGIGFIIGLQICAPINDRIYTTLKTHYSHPTGLPEYRIPLMLPSALLVPLGLFIYGFSAASHTHWIVPNLGAIIFATGLIIGFQCAHAYILDAYTTYAASATGAVAFLRTVAGFGFPLFGPGLYRDVGEGGLGLGWGNGMLGFVALGVGVGGAVGLWVFGERVRGWSRYCAG